MVLPYILGGLAKTGTEYVGGITEIQKKQAIAKLLNDLVLASVARGPGHGAVAPQPGAAPVPAPRGWQPGWPELEALAPGGARPGGIVPPTPTPEQDPASQSLMSHSAFRKYAELAGPEAAMDYYKIMIGREMTDYQKVQVGLAETREKREEREFEWEKKKTKIPETKSIYGIDKTGKLNKIADIPKGAEVRSIESKTDPEMVDVVIVNPSTGKLQKVGLVKKGTQLRIKPASEIKYIYELPPEATKIAEDQYKIKKAKKKWGSQIINEATWQTLNDIKTEQNIQEMLRLRKELEKEGVDVRAILEYFTTEE